MLGFRVSEIKELTLLKSKIDGGKWKDMLFQYFNDDISSFNTPKSKNIIKLFDKYLKYDIKTILTWGGVTPNIVCNVFG